MSADCDNCGGCLDADLVCRFCEMDKIANELAEKNGKLEMALVIATSYIETIRGFLTTHDASGEKKDLATKCLKEIEGVLN